MNCELIGVINLLPMLIYAHVQLKKFRFNFSPISEVTFKFKKSHLSMSTSQASSEFLWDAQGF